MRDMKDLKSEIWELVNKKRDIQKRANNLQGPDMAAAEAAEVVVGVLRGIVAANSPTEEAKVAKVAARDAVDSSFVSVGRKDDLTMMGSGSKGKKGKRGQRREAKRLQNPKAAAGLDCCLDLSFMQQCSVVGVSPPATIEAVPELLAQVEAMKAEAKAKAEAKFEAVSGKCTAELAEVQTKLDALEAKLSALQAADREEVAQIKARALAKAEAAAEVAPEVAAE
ncbi:hypothetical protein KIPB_002672 [Kipferlia bialata]|uniref:Uncharacterized protein n=1 Tax=Kipferlia bialata TaxID=797122 RepID=A0A391NJH8_9EUKA|nr:hypothetical protein KIPB_002672 [Kipferlia bialata]|eukprot:g2672.t1